jgi:hypothetical protein
MAMAVDVASNDSVATRLTDQQRAGIGVLQGSGVGARVVSAGDRERFRRRDMVLRRRLIPARHDV